MGVHCAPERSLYFISFYFTTVNHFVVIEMGFKSVAVCLYIVLSFLCRFLGSEVVTVNEIRGVCHWIIPPVSELLPASSDRCFSRFM